MHIETSDCEVLKISGNACPRGLAYAKDEVAHPKRTVTSTVRSRSGHLVAVKTSAAIPKELIFECMDEINSAVAEDDVCVGDVIIKNVLGTGADIVATSEILL